MKISLNWLNTHIELSETPDQIAELLTNCGLEVEDHYPTETVKGGLSGLIVGQVVEAHPHPNADKLKLTKVDTGRGELLSIVCGAPNVEAGQKVIVAEIGVTIHPLKGEPFTIKKAKIRGEDSEGMLCAEDEIGLGNSHDGLLILDKDCIVGHPLTKYIKVENDFIFEIGLTPNRGDAASHLGIARDLKAILNRPLIQQPAIEISPTTETTIGVSLNDANACGRYSGIDINNVSIKPSPDWLQKRLKSIGINPINNVVDITNYVMHNVGQPMHAFDADKLAGNINIRYAKPGELLVTLDNVERKLSGEELVIADDNGAIALAGVMGGLSTAINESTKNIFLESAWFDPAVVRKTAKKHGLSTDSSFRFERGINPHYTVNALLMATDMVCMEVNQAMCSSIVDVLPNSIISPEVSFSFQKFKNLSGVDIDHSVLKTILLNLDIEILSENEKELLLRIPNYRLDVTRDIDVFEDILRIYGYNNIPFPVIMHGAAVVQPNPDKTTLKNILCNYLSSQGFNEILTNSLTSETYFTDSELSNSVKLLNPLSNELSILRPGILPSLLEIVAYNKNRKADDLKFYEFGKIYQQTEKGYRESEKLALVVTGNKQKPHWRQKESLADYYYLKSIVQNCFASLGINNVKATVDEVDSSLLKKLDVKGTVWYAEINMDSLVTAFTKKSFKLKEIPVFPEVSRDLNLVFGKTVLYKDIEDVVVKITGPYLRAMNLIDVYEGKPLQEGEKAYTINLVLGDTQKTMTDTQIDAIMQKLITTFESKLNAVIRK